MRKFIKDDIEWAIENGVPQKVYKEVCSHFKDGMWAKGIDMRNGSIIKFKIERDDWAAFFSEYLMCGGIVSTPKLIVEEDGNEKCNE